LGIRKTAWQALSERDKTILRAVGILLDLGKPAEYETPTAVRWLIFDDWRFKAVPIAYFGCIVANLADIPANYIPPTDPVFDENGVQIGEVLNRSLMRSQIKTWCEDPTRTNPLVLPKDITFTDGGNVWQEILDAQGTPVQVRMASGVPESWMPVEVGG